MNSLASSLPKVTDFVALSKPNGTMSALVIAFILVAVVAFLVGAAVGGCVEHWKTGGSRELAKDCNTALREAEALRKTLYSNLGIAKAATWDTSLKPTPLFRLIPPNSNINGAS